MPTLSAQEQEWVGGSGYSVIASGPFLLFPAPQCFEELASFGNPSLEMTRVWPFNLVHDL